MICGREVNTCWVPVWKADSYKQSLETATKQLNCSVSATCNECCVKLWSASLALYQHQIGEAESTEGKRQGDFIAHDCNSQLVNSMFMESGKFEALPILRHVEIDKCHISIATFLQGGNIRSVVMVRKKRTYNNRFRLGETKIAQPSACTKEPQSSLTHLKEITQQIIKYQMFDQLIPF